MKSKSFLGIYIPTVFLLMLFPFILDLLIKNGIISFSPGAIDSWIDFWGSYVGAIIGASVVYFVAVIQVKKQNELQMASIELRAKYELQREMKFFYMTKLMEKIEEFIEATDELLDHILVINLSMIEIANALTVKDNYDEQEVMNNINSVKTKCDETIERSEFLLSQIDKAAFYTELYEEREKVITHMHSLIDEYVNIEQHYRKYYINMDKLTGGVERLGVAAEAGNEISIISQQLRQTLTNIQHTLSENN